MTRQIAGTQHSREAIPPMDEEPKWMKLSVTAPVPAGSAMVFPHATCTEQMTLSKCDHRFLAWPGYLPLLCRRVAVPSNLLLRQ